MPIRLFALSCLSVCVLAAPVVAPTRAAPTPARVDTAVDARPPAFSINRSPSISFSSKTRGASFQCSLDGAAYSVCGSPVQFTDLPLGSHVFAVKAIAPNGTADPTPARYRWRVVADLNPPVIQIANLPASGPVSISFLRNLSGTATAAAGISRVQVALRVWGIRRQPSLYSPTYCLFGDLHSGKVVVSPCLQPIWIRPRGGSHWRLRVQRKAVARLPHVTYELQVRAFNRAGEGVIVRKKIEIRD